LTLVDANVLLYAKFVEFPLHEPARAWLDRKLCGSTAVGLPWASLLAFLRIGSSARLLRRPLPLRDGMRQVDRWLAAPRAWTPAPTDRHAEVLAGLLSEGGTSPKTVTDAHLAALAIEHGLTLCTTDSGFGRFAGLRWENPLAV